MLPLDVTTRRELHPTRSQPYVPNKPEERYMSKQGKPCALQGMGPSVPTLTRPRRSLMSVRGRGKAKSVACRGVT